MRQSSLLLLSALLGFTSTLAAQAPAGGSGPVGPPNQAGSPNQSGAAPQAGAQTPGGPQNPSGAGGGLSREQMWYAPTEADWAKPCLIVWQRTYEDAVQVSEETGKPILVCVNMDGEIASEHYAGIRYRQQEIAELYAPYVCVIASTYRHNPRDYDEHGERLLCPRFGSVTCGEHIRIEPGLFNEFLDDTRVAPRHIMVENGKQEQYDVYYAFDTDSVFSTIREGIENRPDPVATVDRGDQGLFERVTSSDVIDRQVVERAYIEGDRVVRKELLKRATSSEKWNQVELLRLALFGDDAELSQVAWGSLLKTNSPQALPLVSEVLNFDLEPEERDAMIECLARLGADSPQAQRLARVYRGLADEAQGFDAELWRRALLDPESHRQWPSTESLQAQAELTAAALEDNPGDLQALLRHASSVYDLAYQPGLDSKVMRVSLEDARDLAERALKLGAEGWEVHSLLAATDKALWERQDGYLDAEKAMASVPKDPGSWRSKETIALFAEARQRQIYRKMVNRQEWPTSWMSDVHAAFQLLSIHPYGSASDLARHHDYLDALKAKGYAGEVLDLGIDRFGDSPLIHARLRSRLLEAKSLESLEGLERTYEKLLANSSARDPQQRGDLHWYAGYASMVAAEFHRRRGEGDAARNSYERAMEQFEISVVHRPENQDSADHYIALSYAGLSRLDLEQQAFDKSLDNLVTCFTRSPGAANKLDGLGITPVMTATTLGARLDEQGLLEHRRRLNEALGDLPPELLQAPDFEKVAPGTGEAGRRDLDRRGRGRRR